MTSWFGTPEDSGESKPLLDANPVDVAVIWVSKAQSGSLHWVDSLPKSQLDAYHLKKRLWPVTTVVKWALLLMAAVETPSYCLHEPELCPTSRTSQEKGLRHAGGLMLAPWITNLICVALWGYLLFHIALRRRALGTAYELTQVRVACIVIVVVALLDCSIAIFNNNLGLPFTGTFRTSRLFRPIAFLLFTKALRDAAGRLLSAIPGFIDVMLSLLIAILFFSWIGLVLFVGTSESQQFSSWSAAISNLWQLFTTANNPDVWLPGYRSNTFTVIFFVAFLLITVYLLNNILLAAVYDSYKEQLKTFIRTFYGNRSTAFAHAFELLSDEEQQSISLAKWKEFFPRLCRELGMEELGHSKAEPIYNALDVDGQKGLDLQEFSAVLSVLQDPKLFIPTKPPKRTADLSPLMQFVRRTMRDGVSIAGHRVSFGHFVDCLIFVDVCLVMRQSMLLVGNGSYSQYLLENTPIFYALLALTTFYSAVLFLKIQAQGFEQFWFEDKLQNRCDFFNVFPCLVLEVTCAVADLSMARPTPVLMRLVILLHVTRVVRLLKHVKPLRFLSTFVIEIAPTYYRMGTLLFLVFYVYAMIGEQFFGGLIYTQNPRLAGTPFANSGYWEINFNDFISSIITMFVVMVLNNWTVIMGGYITASGTRFACAFFVSFFVVVNMTVLNILMALILECSSTLRAEIDSAEEDQTGHGRSTRSYEETLRKVLLGEDDDPVSPTMAQRSP